LIIRRNFAANLPSIRHKAAALARAVSRRISIEFHFNEKKSAWPLDFGSKLDEYSSK
jgi:hypothetical protein